jgi:hypothetical protein
MCPFWPVAAALFVLPVAWGVASICPAPCTTDPSKWTPYSSLENLTECHHPVLLDFSPHGSPNASEVSFRVLACTIEENRDRSFVSPFAARELGEQDPSDSADDDESSQELDDESSQELDDESSQELDDESSQELDDESSQELDDESSQELDDESSQELDDESSQELDESSQELDDESSQELDDESSQELDDESSQELDDESSQELDDESSQELDESSQELDSFLDRLQTVVNQTSNRDTFSVLGILNTTLVGIYRGAKVNDATAASAVEKFRDEWDSELPRRAAIQLCSGDRDADHTFGIALGTTGSIGFVQEAIKAWTVGRCFLSQDAFNLEDSPVGDNATLPSPSLDYTCEKQTVREGDTCATLAKRCGVSGLEFMEYNPKRQLCAWLRPGEEVCCSSKKWTKGKPVMNRDGSCAAYLTEDNDTCASIAQAHNMEVERIRYYNDGRTWGWTGCDQLHGGLRICLSDGYPPLPAPKAGAICGPTVPGTKPPLDGAPLGALNPCPLNACCNTLGECGTTPDYCIYEEGPTGNPGTAPPGKKGCISNCGMEIVDNSPPPTEFMRIGYYESFNLDRPCLNLQAAHIKVNDYSHIHWAFVSISSDFQISVNDTYNQWEDFIALKGVKRIASFGGWGYSVNSASYDVLREAMLPENVDTFIVSIMEFVADNNLDGVDFDWEYPGVRYCPRCNSSCSRILGSGCLKYQSRPGIGRPELCRLHQEASKNISSR